MAVENRPDADIDGLPHQHPSYPSSPSLALASSGVTLLTLDNARPEEGAESAGSCQVSLRLNMSEVLVMERQGGTLSRPSR